MTDENVDRSAPARLAESAAALRSGRKRLEEYLHEICDRIDANEIRLRALVPEPERRERLLREAQSLLHRFPEPAARPALFGVPVGVKDIFSVDGFETRAGTALPPSLFSGGAEATSVARLREAGALVLGKTVTTEFACLEPAATANPRAPAHTPGGSSSGSAAAVAAGYAPLALGTQTIGSVTRPAAYCGIVGVKPSHGRVPGDGLVPFSDTFDQIGFFVQDVEGAALAARAIVTGWKSSSEDVSRRQPVLGVPDGPYLDKAERAGIDAFESHLASLRERGLSVKRVVALGDFEEIAGLHVDLCAAEFADVHREWFARHGPLYRPISIEFIERGRAVAEPTRALARESARRLRAGLHALMDEHGLDLWVSPAALGPAPRGLRSTGSPVMNLPWTHAGLPTVTVPASVDADGLPMGLQIAARFGDDERMLAWAREIEGVLPGGRG